MHWRTLGPTSRQPRRRLFPRTDAPARSHPVQHRLTEPPIGEHVLHSKPAERPTQHAAADLHSAREHPWLGGTGPVDHMMQRKLGILATNSAKTTPVVFTPGTNNTGRPDPACTTLTAQPSVGSSTNQSRIRPDQPSAQTSLQLRHERDPTCWSTYRRPRPTPGLSLHTSKTGPARPATYVEGRAGLKPLSFSVSYERR